MTLEEAKELVEKGRKRGITCPCCEQFCKDYSRRIYKTMARGLIYIVKQHDRGAEWVSSLEVGRAVGLLGGDIAKLRYWGLVEKKPLREHQDKKDSGFWRATEKGIKFAYNELKIPSHILIYNDTFLGFDPDSKDISIVDALGKNFSYHELMSEVPA